MTLPNLIGLMITLIVFTIMAIGIIRMSIDLYKDHKKRKKDTDM